MKRIKFTTQLLSLLLLMLSLAACSSDELFNSNEQNDNEGEGIPFSVTIDAGDTASRLSLDHRIDEDINQFKWSWEYYDKLYAIDSNGKYLGTLSISDYTSTWEDVTFSGKLTLHDGEKIYLWYLGREDLTNALKGPAADAGIKTPSPLGIVNGKIQVDFSKQFSNQSYGTWEIMSAHGNVTVSNGKATMDKVTMKHHTSVTNLSFSNKAKDESLSERYHEYITGQAGYGPYGKTLTLNGLKSKATFDLVRETITETAGDHITIYASTADVDQCVGFSSTDLVLVPGDNSIQTTYSTYNDIVYDASLPNFNVPAGKVIGNLSDAGHHSLGVQVKLAPMSRQPYVCPLKFNGETQDQGPCFFARGNTFATNVGGEGGSKMEIATNQFYTNETDNYAKLTGPEKHSYEFFWLDSKSSAHPEFDYGFYSTNDSWNEVLFQKDHFNFDNELNPGKIFMEQHPDVHARYTLPSVNDYKSIGGYTDGITDWGIYYHAMASVNYGGVQINGLLFSNLWWNKEKCPFTDDEIAEIFGTTQKEKISVWKYSFGEGDDWMITDITPSEIEKNWLVFIPCLNGQPSVVTGMAAMNHQGVYWTNTKGTGIGNGSWPYTIDFGVNQYRFYPYGGQSSFMMRFIQTTKTNY